MRDAVEQISILHYADMSGMGGTERYLVGFLSRNSTRYRLRQGVEILKREHPSFEPGLRDGKHGIYYAKRVGPLKIPKYPPALREAYHRRVARAYSPGIGLIWNRIGDVTALRRARAGGLTVVHWERGFGWFDDEGETNIRSYLGGIDAAFSNSYAGARILQLGWDFDRPVEVLRNTLRGDAPAARTEPRRLPTDRPLRLGACGRLLPFKGVSLALHALRELMESGVEASLEIAGTGPLAQQLDDVIRRLGIGDRTRLLGEVGDIEAFYDRIDLLLHPALREPCANVIPEAMARGCPVIAGNVDGVPELVDDGVTGTILEPSLPLSDYARFGAHVGRLPRFVYHPLEDTVGEPRLLDPALLADAVRGYVDDPSRYADHSAGALKAVHARFDPAPQFELVLDRLNGLLTPDHQKMGTNS
ncbi:MAG: glycosyltransferase family 4 protein [Gemmatimonadota bacterium]|nr:glycosyltransferase family 4 protein [Gemmatimonadota bacterium]